jgi:hypothetical protein
MKDCIHCKRTLEEKSFVKTRQGNRGSVCHTCRSKQKSSSYKYRKYRRDHLKKRYSLSISEYEKLLDDQGGLCAICQAHSKLVVDHCHETGIVRGLLCQQCNSGIGMLKDDPNLVRAALQYLS